MLCLCADEQALQKEKEKVALRVNETKGRRLQDVEDLLPEVLSPVPAAAPSSSLMAGDAIASGQQLSQQASSQQQQTQQILTLEDGTLDDLIGGGGGGGGAHMNDMSLVSESFDLGDEATTGAIATQGGTLASASVDSGAGPAGNGLSTDGTVASKKTRRLVKTLSQKFDVNAAYGS